MQVERGTVGAKVQFDIEAGGDQHIQVLTREGVHVAGTAALTNAQANNLMSLDSGFGREATATPTSTRSGARLTWIQR